MNFKNVFSLKKLPSFNMKALLRKAHDGHHKSPGIVIQKYTEFVLEDAPPLVDLQNKLACRGLKDPWIRNEIWRYRESEFSTTKKRALLFFTRGMLVGFISGAITAFVQKTYEKQESHGSH